MPGWRDLPPLRALAAFEAAGRRRNLRVAARELGVSQYAISQHVARIEAAGLVRPLSHHGHRGVMPAPEGTSLLQATTGGCDAMEGVCHGTEPWPRFTRLFNASLENIRQS